MAKSKSSHYLNEVISLCKKRGFVFQGAGDGYAYGPLGAELKRNFINEWWHAVVTSNEFVFALDAPSQGSINGEEKVQQQCTSTLMDCFDSHDCDVSLLQGTLHHLSDCVESVGIQLPFGIAQTGKKFRKRTSCQNFILKGFPLARLRSREHDLVSLHFFCSPDEQRQWYSLWQKRRLRWWKKFSNHPEKFVLGEGGDNSSLAETANQYMHSGIQFEFPWGSHDLETFANLGDSFLEKVSHRMSDEDGSNSFEKAARLWGRESLPFLISLETDIDAALLAYICDAYSETDGVLRLHRSLAPYKAAVLPQDPTNDKLSKYCRKLSMELCSAGISALCSVAGPLEQRLQIQDEIGTPYRVLADEGLLASGVVKLQDRDTTVQEEMNGKDILQTLMKCLGREHNGIP